MTPAAVLFDMDGTLFDSEKLWDIALEEVAAAYGAVLPVQVRLAMVGRDIDDCMVDFVAGIGQPWRTPAEAGAAVSQRVEQLFLESLEWRPGALELLMEVRTAGIPTALVTSTRRNLVEIALETIGRHRIDVSVCGDEVEFTKPHAEPYRKAARLLGVDPADCVAVEDSPTGTASAQAAGARVLAVPHHVPLPAGPRTVIAPTLAGVTLEHLAAIPH